MFTIGEFARFGDISIRMLRHYDEIGLLTPVRVDPVTGYRRYSIAQLRELNRIVALRGLGFSLAEVRQLLSGITAVELRGMLLLRRADLERQLAADRLSLSPNRGAPSCDRKGRRNGRRHCRQDRTGPTAAGGRAATDPGIRYGQHRASTQPRLRRTVRHCRGHGLEMNDDDPSKQVFEIQVPLRRPADPVPAVAPRRLRAD
jgi:DNA-binding transcriptional MerR regulator